MYALALKHNPINIMQNNSFIFMQPLKNKLSSTLSFIGLSIKRVWISTVDKLCMAYGYIWDKLIITKLIQVLCTRLTLLSTEKKGKKQFNFRDLSVNWHLSTRLTMMMNYIYNLMYLYSLRRKQ